MVIQTIKNAIKDTFLYDVIKVIKQKKDLLDWEKSKFIPPPYVVKQKTVKEYAKKFFIHILIETGTYEGDMIYATKTTFSKIFSVELGKTLYEQAKKRFSRFAHISIIQGDSTKVLPDILANIRQPCLFWLDGHYSGGITAKDKLETPIMQELRHILDCSIAEYVILIDDARLFVGRNSWPTIKELQDLIFKAHSDWVFEVKDDIIRIHP